MSLNFKNVFLMLLIGVSAILGSQAAAAAEYICGINQSTPLYGMGAAGSKTLNVVELDPGKYWVTDNIAQIDSPEFYNCADAIPGKAILPSDVQNRTLMISGSAFLMSTKLTVGGKDYYKLKATGSSFLDNYGYIHVEAFDMDGGGGMTVPPSNSYLPVTSTNVPPKLNFGLRNLQLLFTQPPTVAEYARLSIYAIMNFDALGDSITSGNSVHNTAILKLSILPLTAKTCDISHQSIILPTINLNATPTRMGHTPFSITAVCPIALADEELQYRIVDSMGTSNIQAANKLYTSLNSEFQNINFFGIEINDESAIRLTNTTYSFGILPKGQTSLTKKFIANYFAGSTARKPGVVSAQASFFIQYK